MDNTVIKLDNLTKEYVIYKKNSQRMLSLLFNRKGGIRKTAVNGISLEIAKGERVCLIGSLGSGRSTLLRLISGITFPTSGTVTVAENVDVVFELKSGFDPQLSGRDNIYTKGAILGWSKSEIKEIEQRIIDFADVKDYIDIPIRNYSPGMAGRIAFAMYMEHNPKILLMDESFSVGSKEYRDKCIDRLDEVTGREDVTFMLVTKNIALAKRVCERGIVIDNGELKFDGSISEAFKFYKANCKKNTERNDDDEMQIDDEEEFEF